MDAFLLNGPLTHPQDANLFEFIEKEKQSDELLLLPVTYGGDPDVAYKLGRHLQTQYAKISVLVSGHCKSAGTLLAIAGHELIFGPYGELGPLDIQVPNMKNPEATDSGLDITEGLKALERQSQGALRELISRLRQEFGDDITPEAAADIANGLIGGTYGHTFKNFDPVEVGARARAMRIGMFYGRRLNFASRNLKGEDAKEMLASLRRLVERYPSHTFAISDLDALALFKRVRKVSGAEKSMIREQGANCLIPNASLCLHNLSEKYRKLQEEQEG